MPDGAPIPPDVIRDDLDRQDRSIEAIARRVYEATFTHSSPYRHEIASVCKRFEAALARELTPVRRVRDAFGNEWIETSPGRFNALKCAVTLETIEQDGPVGDLPPAYIGKSTLPVKEIAAELWAAYFDMPAGCQYQHDTNTEPRQRFEAAVQRLMMPEAPKAEPQQATVAELIEAAQRLAGQQWERHIAAQPKDWPKIRELTHLLESLGESRDCVAEIEIPF